MKHLEILIVDPRQLPPYLIEQKTDWDVEAFYKYAMDNPIAPMKGVLMWHECVPVACGVLVADPIYRQVYVDTLIVDKDYRAEGGLNADETFVKAAFRALQDTADALAREMGYDTTSWRTAHPRAMKKLISGDYKATETFMVRKIEPETAEA